MAIFLFVFCSKYNTQCLNGHPKTKMDIFMFQKDTSVNFSVNHYLAMMNEKVPRTEMAFPSPLNAVAPHKDP